MTKYDWLILLGCALVFLGFGVVHGQNGTNSTAEMVFADRWNCGYINTTTTLEDIRSCFRD